MRQLYEKHPSSDRNCPRNIQQKEIIKIKTIQKFSYGAAKRKYEMEITTKTVQNITQSYFAIATVTSPNQSTKQSPSLRYLPT